MNVIPFRVVWRSRNGDDDNGVVDDDVDDDDDDCCKNSRDVIHLESKRKNQGDNQTNKKFVM